jgi:two-component system response regulator HydG
MTLALFASNKLLLSSIGAALRRESIDVSTFVLTSQLNPGDILPAVTKGLLITNESGIINIGEQTEQVRDLLGEGCPLILCAPQSVSSDRELLKQCGAAEIIIPQSWDSNHVGERILGQLILSGAVTPARCGALCGATMRARELYADIERLAPLSEPILLLGETGTGKDLVARELHNRSKRENKYIPINCPEIQPDLISSELFGHEKGAFTGADKSRVGLIAMAGNGTIFLDEIGDLDLQSQAKLLRVLEDHKVRRVGANNFEDVKARIILATNRDLQSLCAEGKFRPDLYERICGFTLEIPPLRERKADIPVLVQHFVDGYNAEYKTDYKTSEGSTDYLFHYDWPGNIRELRAVVRRSAAYSDLSGYISSLILKESVRRPQVRTAPNAVPFDPAVDTWRDLLSRAQTTYFRALLAHTNGSRESAIKLSGLSKSQFFEKLKEVPKEM